MSLYYDNKQNRIFVRRNNQQQTQQLQQQQQQSQFQPYQNQQQQIQQQYLQHQKQFQQHQQQQIQQNHQQQNNIDLNSNILNENKINEGINLIDNLVNNQTQQNQQQQTIYNPSENQNLVELNINEFMNKVNNQNHNQNQNQNQTNVIEGPRGLPGLRGPPGPPGNSLDDNTLKEIKELIQKSKKNQINSNSNSKTNESNEQNHNQNQNQLNRTLLYGIKKTNITELNNNKLSSSSYFKMMKNNDHGNHVVYDSFYLSPNILEINEHSSYNYIHSKKVEKFTNIFDKNDYQYFPIDYVPAGYPINIKNNQSIFNNLIIQNLSWNIIQNIHDSKYEDTGLLGIVPNVDEFIYKNINLTLNFELHSQIPLQLLTNKGNIIPYRNNNIQVINPSKTCLFQVKNVKINKLNGFLEEKIKISLTNFYNLHNSLLCIRISLDDDETYYLKGFNNNNKLTYGYIPLNQIIINFDYYLQ